ncbi:modification methylase PvuII [Candidatus Termititenax aidoneus]|uniref:Methyltransferase n=1 Tax=Termititenax aidoneus TaxID=2218524 RepID=A0A388T918_TERA1|nr:modification methylase PvuII [Candidatus Termititenax aidoneus]
MGFDFFYSESINNQMIGYETNQGISLQGNSINLLQTIKDESINLVVTSPPFALQRQKSYGNKEQNEYVDWLCEFGKAVYPKLKNDGSFVIDIGGAYEKGTPVYSLYQFRVLIKLCDEIGYDLAQPFYWHNPSALPAPIEWVNKRKVRAKTSVNTVWWLCKNAELCKANVSNVLTPYSARMQRLIRHPEEFIKEEGTIRPSGHILGMSSWSKDNGGAIPPNLLQFSNSESNSQYLKYCKDFGITSHPARFPVSLPEFFIKFLTDTGDLVVDIFAGSNTTGYVAERLNRKWVSFELSKDYVANSIFRFIDEEYEAKELYDEIMTNRFVQVMNKQPVLFTC